jgi:hypothetical protein
MIQCMCRRGCCALLAFCISSFAIAASWNVRVDERHGLPSVSKGGAIALSSSFAYWTRNWVRTDPGSEFKVDGPYVYSIAVQNAAAEFNLVGRVTRASARQLTWEFDLDTRRSASGAAARGLLFQFDLTNAGGALGRPRLLPGNRGWVWGAGSTRIEMRIDPALPAVVCDGDNKSDITVFFDGERGLQNRQHYVATMSLSGDVTLAPAVSEKFGPVDFSTWTRGILEPTITPVDLSFLNVPEVPAGKHGFLKARADQLVFEDGSLARFWGTNLTASALFQTAQENVKKEARRLSQLGFNLVRLTHEDSEWVNPNIFGDSTQRDTGNLSDAMLEKLDWWIKCLKDEGIYVWLDLEVGRRLKQSDGVEDFAEIKRGQAAASLKGYNYVNDSIQVAMKRFNASYLNHQNPFTGLRYKDEPAIAALLITNENDLTNHFGNALLPNKDVPRHAARYMRLAREFADKHSLPRNRIWRAWEAGPSKLFLNDLEERFDIGMIAHLRELGVSALIAPSSTWGRSPLSSLPALTVGDVIDVHSYGAVGELERNPIYGANLVHWIAAAQVVGKPLTVTEWGLDGDGTLTADRQDIPLYVAASAAMQGWNALMFFAYSQEAFVEGEGSPSVYHAYNDPALIASLPAAALLYRQGHVSKASTTYVFAPSTDELFNSVESPGNSVALRTASERGRLLIAIPKVAELPWLKASALPQGANVLRRAHEAQIPADATQIVSDSGELVRNWEEGVFTIDTPRTQAVMGWVGGKVLALTDVEAKVTTRNALVAVQSLDGKALRRSRQIMISVAARSLPRSDGALPFYSEPVEGSILITAPHGLNLSARDGRNGRMRRLPVSYSHGRYGITFDRSLQSGWLVLQPSRR